FLFQAEDGIRDDLVTGVQTCALPISRIKAKTGSNAWWKGQGRKARFFFMRPSRSNTPISLSSRSGASTASGSTSGAPARKSFCRSEERREGKRVDLGSSWLVE